MWGIQTDWVPTCLVPIESQFFLSVPGLREVKLDHQLSLVSSGSASAGMTARHGKQVWQMAKGASQVVVRIHGPCPRGAAPAPQNRTPKE